MLETKEVSDITIIGGGPTGMFAAFYAGMRNAKTKIIESLPVLGGQIGILYPDKKIYDIGGYAGVTGTELVEELQKQMDYFDPSIHLEEKVLSINKQEDKLFRIETTKATHHSKSIIITTGQGSFKPRKLPIDNAEQFEENNLHYIVKDLNQYKNKTVVVCGGGDSAVDWALTLEPIAKKVFLVHRRNKFRAHEASVVQLENSSIEIITPYKPYKLHGEDSTLQAVTFQKSRSEETLTVNVDYFIVNYGFVSSMDEIHDWGVSVENQGVLVNQKMETNVPGIYAAGDIASFDGKIKLIATGFGEAPTAVNHAVHYMDPEKYAQPIQSTKLSLDEEN